MLSASPTSTGRPAHEPASRVDLILEAAAAYYEEVLWERSDRVTSWLLERGVTERALHDFQVGYAPERWEDLLERLRPLEPSAAELIEAGLARPTDRGGLRVQFRSRVMFPIRDAEGAILGFAAMATSPGPSWPKWTVSPDGHRYRRGSAMFGLEAAAPAITRSGEALVLGDCLEVMRRHDAGEEATVAVIRSRVTGEHAGQVAELVGVPAADVELVPSPREDLDGGFAAVLRKAAPGSTPRWPLADRAAPVDEAGRTTEGRITPDRERPLGPLEKALLVAGAVVLGAVVPVAWVTATRPGPNSPSGPASNFVVAVGGVVLTYIALTLAVAVVTGQVRKHSRARRMRGVWEMGTGEWQPAAWTYHRFEEMLIGAALVSIIACFVLFLAIGGFSR